MVPFILNFWHLGGQCPTLSQNFEPQHTCDLYSSLIQQKKQINNVAPLMNHFAQGSQMTITCAQS